MPKIIISEYDITNFGKVTRDLNSLHFDPEFAKTTILKGVVAHGLFLLCRLPGILHEVNFWDKSIEALTEASVQFKRPVRAGDTLSYHMCVKNKKLCQRDPMMDEVGFTFAAYNQTDVLVGIGTCTVLMRIKPPSKYISMEQISGL